MRSMGVGGAARPARLDRRLGDLPAGAARGDGPRRQPLAGDPAARPGAPGRADRPGFWHPPAPARSCAGRSSTSGRRRRADARARAPGAPASPDGRRQPRHPADHRGDARACTCSRRPSARARSRRTRSSIDTAPAGRRDRPATVAAERRLVAALRHDPEIDPEHDPRRRSWPAVRAARRAAQANLVDAERPRDPDPRRRRAATPARRRRSDLVHRIRDRYVPAAGFPASTDVLLTGAPAFGVDFIDKRLRRVPVARARGARALLPAAAARVPLGRPAAQGRAA